MLGGITGHRDFARDTGVIVKPRRCDQSRRCRRARVHRARRPHQPQQGAAEIRSRRLGLRQIPDARSRRSSAATLTRLPAEAIAPRPAFDRQRPHRRASAEAGTACTGSVSCCRSASSRPARCAARKDRRMISATATSALRSGRTCLISGVADREDRARRKRQSRRSACRPKRPRSVPASSPAPAAAGCRFATAHTKETAEADRAWCDDACRARWPSEHSSHRLPPFLRPALHRRHRPDRRARRDQRRGRYRRRLSPACRRRLRPGWRCRPRDLCAT